MQLARATGRAAASRKYDILSALMALGLSQDKVAQRQIMRMMALITTRYNWQRDELSMGQREIARLWSVDERTVKREMAKLRGRGWLVQKTRGARGRISTYGIDFERMLEDTRPAWALIGEDFVQRLDPNASIPAGEETATNVVPLRKVVPEEGGSVWGQAQAILHGEDASTYGAWFHGLTEVDREGGTVILAAPSSFIASYVTTHLRERLRVALRRVDPTISDLRVVC
ncbi:DnaA N-terminal domain-containing protein [Maritimibacter alkaliphilus]|uniref:DnaA N-terminal domain-containing protein n=1 Tax=Maritimibacter alkaliphilus TaxID=404236 RepID=UPI001C947039|nr:DnaA N-terminal domain-containing protein [Maritimibacter alkaliphilus]MBY6093007.1 hypothetical protein [Maritimibacter alkaliphilus]